MCHFVVVVIGWFAFFFLEVQRNKKKKKVFPRFYKKQSSREKSVMAVYLSTGIGSELQKESFFSLRFDFIHEKKKIHEISPEEDGDGARAGTGAA